MPANTPARLYPYPVPTDRINVPSDIEALAFAVDVDMNDAVNFTGLLGDRVSDLEDQRTIFIPVVSLVAGNIVGLAEIGSFVIPNDPMPRYWHWWWYLSATNHATWTSVRCLLYIGPTVVSAGLNNSAEATRPMTMVTLGRLSHPANAGPVTYRCLVEVTGGTAPNTNINGGLMAMGVYA